MKDVTPTLGNPFKSHEEFLSSQQIFPPLLYSYGKHFDTFPFYWLDDQKVEMRSDFFIKSDSLFITLKNFV